MLEIKEDKDGVIFKIKVQPRAAKNQLAGIMDGALKIRLTAPPVDGAANEACRSFLAGLLGVARSQVTVVTGQTARYKLVRVSGVTPEQVRNLG